MTKAQELWPFLRDPAKKILRGEKQGEMDGRIIGEVRNSVLKVFGASPAEQPELPPQSTPKC